MIQPGSQIYLDYCATTPVDPEVVAAMMPALEGMFGNPSSMHWAGRQAMDLKEQVPKRNRFSIGIAFPMKLYLPAEPQKPITWHCWES